MSSWSILLKPRSLVPPRWLGLGQDPRLTGNFLKLCLCPVQPMATVQVLVSHPWYGAACNLLALRLSTSHCRLPMDMAGNAQTCASTHLKSQCPWQPTVTTHSLCYHTASSAPWCP